MGPQHSWSGWAVASNCVGPGLNPGLACEERDRRRGNGLCFSPSFSIFLCACLHSIVALYSFITPPWGACCSPSRQRVITAPGFIRWGLHLYRLLSMEAFCCKLPCHTWYRFIHECSCKCVKRFVLRILHTASVRAHRRYLTNFRVVEIFSRKNYTTHGVCCLIINLQSSRDSSVGIVTGQSGFDSRQEQEIFLLSTACKPALGHPASNPTDTGGFSRE
jgi:hypothetical protein